MKETFRKEAVFAILKVRYNSPSRSWFPGMIFQAEGSAGGDAELGREGHLDNARLVAKLVMFLLLKQQKPLTGCGG